MPVFRPTLATADPRPLDPGLVREICAAVTHPANLFVAPPLRVAWEYRPDVEVFWEVFHGRLLDGTQTRQRKRLETWGLFLIDAGERSADREVEVQPDRDGDLRRSDAA